MAGHERIMTWDYVTIKIYKMAKHLESKECLRFNYKAGLPISDIRIAEDATDIRRQTLVLTLATRERKAHNH